jgi:hypothetical protein
MCSQAFNCLALLVMGSHPWVSNIQGLSSWTWCKLQSITIKRESNIYKENGSVPSSKYQIKTWNSKLTSSYRLKAKSWKKERWWHPFEFCSSGSTLEVLGGTQRDKNCQHMDVCQDILPQWETKEENVLQTILTLKSTNSRRWIYGE